MEDPEHKNVAVKIIRQFREDVFIRPNESDYKIYLLHQDMEEILNSPRAKAIYEGFSHREAAEELCRKCGYARRFG